MEPRRHLSFSVCRINLLIIHCCPPATHLVNFLKTKSNQVLPPLTVFRHSRQTAGLGGCQGHARRGRPPGWSGGVWT